MKINIKFLICVLLCLIISVIYYLFPLVKYPYVQEYVIGAKNNKGEVCKECYLRINKNYDIGANKYGYAVFKNPKKAFNQLKKDNKKGLKLISKEFSLLPLSKFNYEKYGNYGCQVTTGTDEEKKQARFVCIFMDIYENSFKGY